MTRSIAALALLALAACAPSSADTRRNDPTLHALKLAVDPEVKAGAADVQPAASRLRAALADVLRARGYASLRPGDRADGVLHLTVDRAAGDRLRAGLRFDAQDGEDLEDVSVERPLTAAADDPSLQAIAQRLVVKMEHSLNVQGYANTGVSWLPVP